jgi:hypothetical protein
MHFSDHIDDLEKNKFRGDHDEEIRVAVEIVKNTVQSQLESLDLLREMVIQLKKIEIHLSEISGVNILDDEV